MLKNFIFGLTIFFSILVLLCNPGYSEGSQTKPVNKAPGETNKENDFSGPNSKKGPIEITANQVTLLQEKNLTIGKGNVNIYYEGIHIQADKAIFNSKTGNGVVSGNVVIEDETSTIKGDKSSFNIMTKKGEIFNAR